MGHGGKSGFQDGKKRSINLVVVEGTASVGRPNTWQKTVLVYASADQRDVQDLVK